MAVDSKALFRERLVAFDLDDVYPEFEVRGWSTLGAFAFACSVPPGAAGGGDALRDEVIIPL
eukprot:8995825-Alexandrium_andersonii.AAC.1